MSIEPLYPNNDWEFTVTTTAGRTVTWAITASNDSNTAIGTLSGTMAESPAGTYTATIQGSDIATHLSALARVSLVVASGSDLRVASNVAVKLVRAPDA
jgi:hypothetical protein